MHLSYVFIVLIHGDKVNLLLTVSLSNKPILHDSYSGDICPVMHDQYLDYS